VNLSQMKMTNIYDRILKIKSQCYREKGFRCLAALFLRVFFFSFFSRSTLASLKDCLYNTTNTLSLKHDPRFHYKDSMFTTKQ